MSDAPLALFVGLAGYELSADEIAFLRDANPFGVFLFRRNIDHRDQVRRLCAAFREAVGRPDAPVFIDQEGGRVQRLDNGNWPSFRSLGSFGALAKRDLALARRATRLSTQAMGAILTDLTIDSGTTPVVETRPTLGLSPTILLSMAGTRPEPAVSVPSAIGTKPAATATAEPELDPPGIRSARSGLRGIGKGVRVPTRPVAN